MILLKDLNIKHLTDILISFGNENTIFHSEAQFQFELAWMLQQRVKCKVKLEEMSVLFTKNIDVPNSKEQTQKIYTDIMLEDESGYRIAIELKYKTAALGSTNSDIFLLNHGAVDLGRYDFLWDVYRIELLLDQKKSSSNLELDTKVTIRKPCNKGFAIMLTNEEKYWKGIPNQTKITIDNQFKIGIQNEDNNTGQLLQNKLDWRRDNGEYTNAIKNTFRAHPIVLNDTYMYEWKNYCKLSMPNCEFKFMIIEAQSKKNNGVTRKAISE